MELNNTIIVPTDNKELAQQLFKSVIFEEDVVVVVVLGEDDKALKAVKGADKRAHIEIQGFKRKVLWIRDKTCLEEEIKALKPMNEDTDISKKDLSTVVAFSVSLAELVKDIIGEDEEVDILRMEESFLKALKGD